MGIRTNAPEVGEWLDVLAAYEVQDEQADPYYSIWLGEQEGNRRGFHILYREAQQSLRTFDLAALASMLFSELEGYMLPQDESALHLKLGLIRRNGVTALVPGTFVPFLRERGTRAERELDLPLTTFVSLDVESGRLLPYERRLDLPDDAVERLAALDPSAAGTLQDVEVPSAPDIACVFLEGDTPVREVPHVQGVYAMSEVSANLGRFGRTGIDAIAQLLEGVPVFALTPASAAEMLPETAALLDRCAPAAT